MNVWFIIIRGVYSDMAKVFAYRKLSIKWTNLLKSIKVDDFIPEG